MTITALDLARMLPYRPNEFNAKAITCPVCGAPKGERCLVDVPEKPGFCTYGPAHVERARQQRWLQMFDKEYVCE